MGGGVCGGRLAEVEQLGLTPETCKMQRTSALKRQFDFGGVTWRLCDFSALRYSPSPVKAHSSPSPMSQKSANVARAQINWSYKVAVQLGCSVTERWWGKTACERPCICLELIDMRPDFGPERGGGVPQCDRVGLGSLLSLSLSLVTCHYLFWSTGHGSLPDNNNDLPAVTENSGSLPNNCQYPVLLYCYYW